MESLNHCVNNIIASKGQLKLIKVKVMITSNDIAVKQIAEYI